MDSFNFTYQANSHTPKVEIHTRQKNMPFWPLYCEREAILSNIFLPVTRAAGVFIWENCHPSCRDLGRKDRDLGNRASQASHMNTSKVLRRKEWRDEISDTEPARMTGFI